MTPQQLTHTVQLTLTQQIVPPLPLRLSPPQRGAYMWMIFKIEDGKAVVMETTGDPGTSWSDLMDHLPQHEPRFVLYDHHFRLGDGCQFNKLVFVVWAPESAPGEWWGRGGEWELG